jgi:hypothetical protein
MDSKQNDKQILHDHTAIGVILWNFDNLVVFRPGHDIHDIDSFFKVTKKANRNIKKFGCRKE